MESLGKMNELTLENEDTKDTTSEVSRSTLASSGSVDLEGGTSIRTTGFSKGFEAGHFLDRNQVPCIEVTGTQIKAHFTSYQVKQLQTYHVRRVLSPFEFYLERESDKSEESLRHNRMQDYYNEQEKQAYEFSIIVSKMSCYAYYDPKSNFWWRVRVQDFESKGGLNHAYIYYCDTGKQEYILCECLRQLKDEFQGAWDSAFLKCYLYDVLPIHGDLHWSLEAIQFFKGVVTNLRLGAVVLKWTRRPVVEYSPDMTVDCGVVLTEKLDPSERPDTINWLMVKMGYARSIGIMSSSPDSLNIPGFFPFFDIPASKGNSRREQNSKEGISPEVLRKITERAMANPAPDLGVPLYCEKPVQSASMDSEICLPFSIRCRLSWMRMSYVVGPSKIFVHTYQKKLELKAMEEEMKKVSLKMASRPSLKFLSPGSVITCDMKDSKNLGVRCWCRAVVLEMDLPKEAASVLMVDYGVIMKVHQSVMYHLPDKFRSIPSFVYRIHLSDVRPNYGAHYWVEAANSVFVKYIMSHENSTPLYYAHVPDIADLIKFTDFNQSLVFNDLSNKWVASDPDCTGTNEAINSMRNDPLLASYFCSRPVNIYYEVFVQPEEFWQFDNLSDYLVIREWAEFIKLKLDKDKIHEILKNGYGTL